MSPVNVVPAFVGFAPVPDTDNPNRIAGYEYSRTVTEISGAAPAAAVATAGSTQNYDFSTNKVLNIHYTIKGGTTYNNIYIEDMSSGASSASAVTATEAAAVLNGNASFARLFTASVNSNALRITSKALGDDIKFYVTGSANTPLGFTAVANGSAAAGTGAATVVACVFKTPSGLPLANQKIAVKLFDASTGATLVTGGIVNPPTEFGTVFSGICSANAVLITDKDGKLTFTIGKASADTGFTMIKLEGAADTARTEYVLGAS